MTADAGPSSPMSERMQALLSRAVEDQLSEQRQLAHAISDFRRQIGKLSKELEELKAEPPDPSETLESGLDAVSADVREAVRLLAERIDKVTRLVQERARELTELRTVVADVQVATGQHAQALAGVAGGLSALPSFGNRIGALQDGLSAVHDRLHGIEELGGTVAQVSHRVDAVDASVRELRGAFAGIAARVGDLPARGDVDTMVRVAFEPLESIAGRLAGVEASGPAVKERLDRLSDGLDSQRALVERVRTRLDEVADGAVNHDTETPERIGRLEAATSALRSRMEELHATPVHDPRVDDVIAAVGEMHDGLFGEDGIEAQVAALHTAPRHDPDLDARIEKTVERVVSEMEQRLSEHVDEAVLALAEALLRRKAARPGAMPTPFEEMAAPEPAEVETPPPPPPPQPVIHHEPVPESYPHREPPHREPPHREPPHREPPHREPVVRAPQAFHQPLVHPSTRYDDDAGDEDDERRVEATDTYPAGFAARSNGVVERRWESNGTADAADATAVATSTDAEDADASRRRRPWWRPTD